MLQRILRLDWFASVVIFVIVLNTIQSSNNIIDAYQQQQRIQQASSSSGYTRIQVEQTLTNLLAICRHLQDLNLYQPKWKETCRHDTKRGLIATKRIKKDEIISLYPVHALGILGDMNNADNQKDFLIYEGNDEYFTPKSQSSSSSSLTDHFRIKFNNLQNDNYKIYEDYSDSLFLDVSPNRPVVPGWFGHLASMSNKDGFAEKANCVLVKLPNTVFPLCALVSLTDIRKGQSLCRSSNFITQEDKVIVDKLQTKYSNELSELEQYYSMAYQHLHTDEESNNGKQQDESKFEFPFYQSINLNYPGLKKLNSDPDIFIVDDFLTEEECNRLIEKARPHLIPCLAKNEVTGQVEQDPSRTSTNANIPRSEVPTIVSKIQSLTGVDDVNRLEILQVLHYDDGQQFLPHTDGFDGPINACGFKDSGRLVTFFCYLNSVSNGGSTKFTTLNLDIQPRQGMAALHFPNTIGLEEDGRTEHQGIPPINGEKWLLVTWIWKDPLSDEQYNESNLPKLSDDRI